MGKEGRLAGTIRGRLGVAKAIAGIGIASAVILGLVGAGCGGGSNGAGLAGSCTLNSDCDTPLVCVFSRCHAQCQTSVDCATGSRCVSSTSPGAPGVCQLEVESSCAGGRPCDGNQVCATADQQCRTPCVETGTCDNGQICITMGTQSLCYQADNTVDQTVLVQAGVLAPDGAVLVNVPNDSTVVVDGGPVDGGADGGAPDGTIGPGAPDGATESGSQDGSGYGGPDAASEASMPNACPISQAQFGNTAQGDSNPFFTSGVGVRGTNALFIFSAYEGPDPDAGLTAAPFDAGDGGEDVDLVYVQAFDVATGASLGPAQPLFAAPAGDGFVVDSAAVASTGQIALAFSYGGVLDYNTTNGNDRSQSALYAALVDPSSDGGSAGVALQKQVELESGQFSGQPHVAWAASSAAFVFSWQYLSGSDWFIGSRNFLATGEAAGGTAPLPTSQPGDVVENPFGTFSTDQGAVAPGPASLFGVVYGESGQQDWLTVFDTTGNPLGTSVRVPTPTDDHYWLAIGATATGFVDLYDTGNTVAEIFVPVTADAGPVPLDAGDSGATPEYGGFTFTGAIHALDVRAVNDDTGGQGGVGAALLYPDGLSFAYVNADGISHVNPISVIAHSFIPGDEINVSNFGGSFGLSIYGAATQSTQIAASGCASP